MMPIYLDNAATTPLHPEVASAMARCAHELGGNPASQHQFGRRARKVLEDARDQIAGILGARTSGVRADRLIFTSGGTESNNLALRGLAGQPPGGVLISAIEHPSVAATAQRMAQSGFELRQLPVSEQGVTLVGALPELIDKNTRLVSVMLANNETGVLQPVAELAEVCESAGLPLHTDAVQAVGKIPVDFRSLGAAALSVSAHKFHGPAGIGALLLRHDLALEPLLFGGFQQQALRPGSEPVALAVGMCRALELWQAEARERQLRITQLRQRLESQLVQRLPGLLVHGAAATRLPHTCCLAFPGVDRQAMVMALDLAGVACSTGSACASGSSEPSPVLLSMGLDRAVVECSIRLSLSAFTTAEEVAHAVACIVRVYSDLRHAVSGRKTLGSSRLRQPKPI